MHRSSFRLLVATVTYAAAAATAVPASAQPGSRLTVERVASLPSLIGTAPSGLAWSPDSSQLAFLWNDEGWPYRDVWVVDRSGGGRRRRR